MPRHPAPILAADPRVIICVGYTSTDSSCLTRPAQRKSADYVIHVMTGAAATRIIEAGKGLDVISGPAQPAEGDLVLIHNGASTTLRPPGAGQIPAKYSYGLSVTPAGLNFSAADR